MSETSQGDTEVGTSASEASESSSVAGSMFPSMEGDKGAEDAGKASDDKAGAPEDTGEAKDKAEETKDAGDEPADKEPETDESDEDESDSDKAEDDKAGEEISFDDLDYSVYPEGAGLDAEASEAFKALAKEQGMSKETAQALLQFDADRSAKLMQSLEEAHTAEVDGWENDTRADQEIGGAKLDDTLSTAAKAIDMFGKDTGIRELMNDTGLGNHPAVVKVFARIGKAISEDSLLTGRESEQPKSAADVLYGDTKK